MCSLKMVLSNLSSNSSHLCSRKDCIIVSGVGCTLVPGLIDAHAHSIDEVQTLRESLRFGVTTPLDMGLEPVYVAKMQQVATQRDDVADYRICCYAATVKGGWPAAENLLIRARESVCLIVTKGPG